MVTVDGSDDDIEALDANNAGDDSLGCVTLPTPTNFLLRIFFSSLFFPPDIIVFIIFFLLLIDVPLPILYFKNVKKKG